MASTAQLAQLFDADRARHLGFDMELGITATGNASQASAYQITANHSQFTVVTSTNNSAKLPLASQAPHGLYIVINDDAADNLNLYPGSGDSINALAADAAIVIPYGAGAYIARGSDTKWVAIKTANGASPTFTGITLSGLSASLPVSTDGSKNLATVALALTNTAAFTAAWSDWVPTYGSSGSLTWGTITTNVARYIQIGKIVRFVVNATGTLGGTASTDLTFTLPIAATTGHSLGGACQAYNGQPLAGVFTWNDTSTIVVRKYDASNWNNSGTGGFVVQGFYQVT